MENQAQPAVPAGKLAQAAYEALHASIARRQPAHLWLTWDAVDEINDGIPGEPLRGDMEAAAQAVVDAATEGSLRACGYTLADVGRFLEAEAAAQDARPAPTLAVLQALRADLEAFVRIWREESQPYPAGDLADNARRSGFGYCADELSKLLGQHPQPKAAPAVQPADAAISAWIENYPREFATWLTTQRHVGGVTPESVAIAAQDARPAVDPVRTEWVVFWGGEDPDDCAGWDSRDDEADAEEHREWITGGGVAQRPVMYGPWTVTVPPPPAERGLSGDWSDEELAEFRRWREQKQETSQ